MDDATRALAARPGPATTGERGAAVTPARVRSPRDRRRAGPPVRGNCIGGLIGGSFLSSRVMR